MHRHVGNDDETRSKHSKPNDIFPQCQVVKAKRAEDAGAGYFNVQPVSVILETQLGYFIDDEGFVAVMEDG